MSQRRGSFLVIAASGFVVLAVLVAWIWWRQQVHPGVLRLTQVSFSELADWPQSDPRPALSAFRRSCADLAKRPGNQSMGGLGYAGTVGDWTGACKSIPPTVATAAGARAYFETWFAPFAIVAGGTKDGMFTGYYEPELRASRTRHGEYQTPVYGLPRDLISVDLGQFRPALKGQRIAGKLNAQRLVPYPTRAEIDAHGLAAAPILFYAADPVAVFFLHVQGSGRVRFDDGSWARVIYAAQNGRPYTAIGHTLVEDAALNKNDVSLQTIRAWLHAHPAQSARVMQTNESYIFFALAPLGDRDTASAGSEGVALTPGASLAVDSRIHGFGVPLYLSTSVPAPDGTEAALHRLVVAQDTGGAIRGPIRGDVYWGVGPQAEWRAGHMKARGRLFVLLPKSRARHMAGATDFALPPS